MPTPFTPAWLAHSPAALPFLPNALGDLETAWSQRATTIGTPRVHPAALKALYGQHARYTPFAAQAKALTLLEEGAFAVLTGQQVGLFLGPLYAIHKAASAIAYAEKAQAILKKPVVPIFWLQTEDADFAEIAGTYSVGPEGLQSLQLKGSLDLQGQALSPERRVSLGDRRLGPEVSLHLKALEDELEGPFRHDILQALAKHYHPEATFGEAAAGLLNELFGDMGLLVFDPRATALGESQHSLSQVKADLVREALAKHASLEEALMQRAQALEDADFKVQIPPRPATSLACFAPCGSDRYRLVSHPDSPETIRLSGHPKRYSRAEFEAELQAHPEWASTTALLRPILQDRLFPTLGYVGGPGELAYFSQLPPLYEVFGQDMPLALPRARFTLGLPQFQRLAKALDLDLEQGLPPQKHVETYLLEEMGVLNPLQHAQHHLEQALAENLQHLEALATQLGDLNFQKRATNYQARTTLRFKRLTERLERAALNRKDAKVSQMKRLYSWLLPLDAPQERTLSLVPFAAQIGFKALAKALVASSHQAIGELPKSRVLRVHL